MYLHENGTVRPVETVLRRGWEIKEKNGGGDSNKDML
jgi:hypothetical protein